MAILTAPDPNLQLNGFFPVVPTGPGDSENGNRNLPRAQYLELEIQQISSLLEPINPAWSRVPRLYIVLRLINQLSVLDTFLAQGLTDFWFPFSLGTLPDGVPLAVRSAFVRTRDLVLTKAVDLEKGEKGRHRHFGADEPLPFVSKGSLGSGGFGAVDRVLSKVSGLEYARKRLPRGKGQFGRAKEHMKAFKTELEVLKRLHHRHAVEYVGSYTDAAHLGIIMAPVADGNMAWFLDCISTGAESKGDAVVYRRGVLRGFFGCLAAALAYLHSSQIRHKDIKPQNILVMGDNVLFTDFGISRDWTEESRSTTKGPAILTPRYAAPEVAEYEPRGSSSDVWSLGCVFLEMLTVLKGETLAGMRRFYEGHGSESQFFRANTVATDEWMKVLEKMGATRADNRPVGWIKQMLEKERADRVTAVSLQAQIAMPDSLTGQASQFCGSCCLEDGDSDDDGFGDGESDPDDNSDDRALIASGTTAVLDVGGEVNHLQQVADTLTPDKLSSRTWKAAAEMALARLENDTSLHSSANMQLQRGLIALLRDTGWSILSGDITGSHPLNQETAKEMLELMERMAMLRQPAEQTPSDRKERAKCLDYMSVMLTEDKLRGRLAEAKKRLLVEEERPLPSLGSGTAAPPHDSEEGDDANAAEKSVQGMEFNGLVDAGLLVLEDPPPRVKVLTTRNAAESPRQPELIDASESDLHAIAGRGDLDALSKLLAADAAIHFRDKSGHTALHCAARGGHESCVMKLLASGAEVTSEDKNRLTPLHVAAKQGNRIVVRELLAQRKAHLNAKTLDNGYAPLHFAVEAGNVAAAELLLKAGAGIDVGDSVGRTPLFLAPNGETLALLLQYNANPLARDHNGRTPLHSAVKERRLGVIPALLAAGIRVSRSDRTETNPFHLAVVAGDQDLVKLLAEKDGTVVDLPNGDSKTPLHIATENADVQMVNLLLRYGAETRFDGFAPLHVAAQSGNLDLVKLFHSRGQDLNVKGKDGLLPLDTASASGDTAMIKFLVKQRAQFTTSTRREQPSLLHIAVEHGDEELVEMLLDSLRDEAPKGSGARGCRSSSPAFSGEGQYGMTVLVASLFYKRPPITRMLLDRGADPDGSSGYYISRRTPLVQAVIKEDAEMIELLLSHGANVHKRDHKNKAPIHYAAETSRIDLAELLLAHGANLNDLHYYFDGKSFGPAYQALEEKQAGMLEFLLGRGAIVHDGLLELAAREDYANMMEIFLSHQGNLETPLTPERLGKLLYKAAERDSVAVGPLLKAGAPPEFDNNKVLISALTRKSRETVRLLLEAGATIRNKGDLGSYSDSPEGRALRTEDTALLGFLLENEHARGGRSRQQVLQEWLRHAGRMVGHEVVKWLYEQGAEGNVDEQYGYGGRGVVKSPLQWAAANNDLEMVRDRLSKGDDVKGLPRCYTPLQFAASKGNAEVVRLLLEHGAKPEDAGWPPTGMWGGDCYDGESALLRATKTDSAECVKLLLAAGADPNRLKIGNDSQRLPLREVLSRIVSIQDGGNDENSKLEALVEMLHALLAAGADPIRSKGFGTDPLHESCAGRKKTKDLVLLLLDHVKKEDLSEGGVSALFLTSGRGDIGLTTLLLDRGVSIHGRYDKSTVLWRCTRQGNEAVVRLLIERGADPDEPGNGNSRQETPRQKAEKTYDQMLIDAIGPKK